MDDDWEIEEAWDHLRWQEELDDDPCDPECRPDRAPAEPLWWKLALCLVVVLVIGTVIFLMQSPH